MRGARASACVASAGVRAGPAQTLPVLFTLYRQGLDGVRHMAEAQYVFVE